jgi:hypothetical protein
MKFIIKILKNINFFIKNTLDDGEMDHENVAKRVSSARMPDGRLMGVQSP